MPSVIGEVPLLLYCCLLCVIMQTVCLHARLTTDISTESSVMDNKMRDDLGPAILSHKRRT